MNVEILKKRKHLQELSKAAHSLVLLNKASNINEALKIIYKDEGHITLKTVKQWNELGYKVKKGEKALTLWARPLHILKDTKDTDEDKIPFFPLVNVFSNLQVEKFK